MDHKRDKIGVFVSIVSTKIPFKVPVCIRYCIALLEFTCVGFFSHAAPIRALAKSTLEMTWKKLRMQSSMLCSHAAANFV
jgi:hypothetical protein